MRGAGGRDGGGGGGRALLACCVLVQLLAVGRAAEEEATPAKPQVRARGAEGGRTSGAATPPPPPSVLLQPLTAAEAATVSGVFGLTLAAVTMTPIGVPVTIAMGSVGLLGPLSMVASNSLLIAQTTFTAGLWAAFATSTTTLALPRLVQAHEMYGAWAWADVTDALNIARETQFVDEHRDTPLAARVGSLLADLEAVEAVAEAPLGASSDARDDHPHDHVAPTTEESMTTLAIRAMDRMKADLAGVLRDVAAPYATVEAAKRAMRDVDALAANARRIQERINGGGATAAGVTYEAGTPSRASPPSRGKEKQHGRHTHAELSTLLAALRADILAVVTPLQRKAAAAAGGAPTSSTAVPGNPSAIGGPAGVVSPSPGAAAAEADVSDGGATDGGRRSGNGVDTTSDAVDSMTMQELHATMKALLEEVRAGGAALQQQQQVADTGGAEASSTSTAVPKGGPAGGAAARPDAPAVGSLVTELKQLHAAQAAAVDELRATVASVAADVGKLAATTAAARAANIAPPAGSVDPATVAELRASVAAIAGDVARLASAGGRGGEVERGHDSHTSRTSSPPANVPTGTVQTIARDVAASVSTSVAEAVGGIREASAAEHTAVLDGLKMLDAAAASMRAAAARESARTQYLDLQNAVARVLAEVQALTAGVGRLGDAAGTMGGAGSGGGGARDVELREELARVVDRVYVVGVGCAMLFVLSNLLGGFGLRRGAGAGANAGGDESRGKKKEEEEVEDNAADATAGSRQRSTAAEQALATEEIRAGLTTAVAEAVTRQLADHTTAAAVRPAHDATAPRIAADIAEVKRAVDKQLELLEKFQKAAAAPENGPAPTDTRRENPPPTPSAAPLAPSLEKSIALASETAADVKAMRKALGQQQTLLEQCVKQVKRGGGEGGAKAPAPTAGLEGVAKEVTTTVNDAFTAMKQEFLTALDARVPVGTGDEVEALAASQQQVRADVQQLLVRGGARRALGAAPVERRAGGATPLRELSSAVPAGGDADRESLSLALSERASNAPSDLHGDDETREALDAIKVYCRHIRRDIQALGKQLPTAAAAALPPPSTSHGELAPQTPPTPPATAVAASQDTRAAAGSPRMPPAGAAPGGGSSGHATLRDIEALVHPLAASVEEVRQAVAAHKPHAAQAAPAGADNAALFSEPMDAVAAVQAAVDKQALATANITPDVHSVLKDLADAVAAVHASVDKHASDAAGMHAEASARLGDGDTCVAGALRELSGAVADVRAAVAAAATDSGGTGWAGPGADVATLLTDVRGTLVDVRDIAQKQASDAAGADARLVDLGEVLATTRAAVASVEKLTAAAHTSAPAEAGGDGDVAGQLRELVRGVADVQRAVEKQASDAEGMATRLAGLAAAMEKQHAPAEATPVTAAAVEKLGADLSHAVSTLQSSVDAQASARAAAQEQSQDRSADVLTVLQGLELQLSGIAGALGGVQAAAERAAEVAALSGEAAGGPTDIIEGRLEEVMRAVAGVQAAVAAQGDGGAELTEAVSSVRASLDAQSSMRSVAQEALDERLQQQADRGADVMMVLQGLEGQLAGLARGVGDVKVTTDALAAVSPAAPRGASPDDAAAPDTPGLLHELLNAVASVQRSVDAHTAAYTSDKAGADAADIADHLQRLSTSVAEMRASVDQQQAETNSRNPDAHTHEIPTQLRDLQRCLADVHATVEARAAEALKAQCAAAEEITTITTQLQQLHEATRELTAADKAARGEPSLAAQLAPVMDEMRVMRDVVASKDAAAALAGQITQLARDVEHVRATTETERAAERNMESTAILERLSAVDNRMATTADAHAKALQEATERITTAVSDRGTGHDEKIGAVLAKMTAADEQTAAAIERERNAASQLETLREAVLAAIAKSVAAHGAKMDDVLSKLTVLDERALAARDEGADAPVQVEVLKAVIKEAMQQGVKGMATAVRQSLQSSAAADAERTDSIAAKLAALEPCLASVTDAQTAALETRLAEVATAVAASAEKTASVAGTITALNLNIAAMKDGQETVLERVAKDMATAEEAAVIPDRSDELRAEMADLMTHVTSIADVQNTLRTNVADVLVATTERVATDAQTTDSLTTKMAAIDTRTAALEESVASIAAAIAASAAMADGVSASMVTLTEAMASLKDAQDGAAAAADADRASDIAAQLAGLKDGLMAVNEAQDALRQGMAGSVAAAVDSEYTGKLRTEIADLKDQVVSMENTQDVIRKSVADMAASTNADMSGEIRADIADLRVLVAAAKEAQEALAAAHADTGRTEELRSGIAELIGHMASIRDAQELLCKGVADFGAHVDTDKTEELRTDIAALKTLASAVKDTQQAQAAADAAKADHVVAELAALSERMASAADVAEIATAVAASGKQTESVSESIAALRENVSAVKEAQEVVQKGVAGLAATADSEKPGELRAELAELKAHVASVKDAQDVVVAAVEAKTATDVEKTDHVVAELAALGERVASAADVAEIATAVAASAKQTDGVSESIAALRENVSAVKEAQEVVQKGVAGLAASAESSVTASVARVDELRAELAELKAHAAAAATVADRVTEVATAVAATSERTEGVVEQLTALREHVASAKDAQAAAVTMIMGALTVPEDGDGGDAQEATEGAGAEKRTPQTLMEVVRSVEALVASRGAEEAVGRAVVFEKLDSLTATSEAKVAEALGEHLGPVVDGMSAVRDEIAAAAARADKCPADVAALLTPLSATLHAVEAATTDCTTREVATALQDLGGDLSSRFRIQSEVLDRLVDGDRERAATTATLIASIETTLHSLKGGVEEQIAGVLGRLAAVEWHLSGGDPVTAATTPSEASITPLSAPASPPRSVGSVQVRRKNSVERIDAAGTGAARGTAVNTNSGRGLIHTVAACTRELAAVKDMVRLVVEGGNMENLGGMMDTVKTDSKQARSDARAVRDMCVVLKDMQAEALTLMKSIAGDALHADIKTYRDHLRGQKRGSVTPPPRMSPSKRPSVSRQSTIGGGAAAAGESPRGGLDGRRGSTASSFVFPTNSPADAPSPAPATPPGGGTPSLPPADLQLQQQQTHQLADLQSKIQRIQTVLDKVAVYVATPVSTSQPPPPAASHLDSPGSGPQLDGTLPMGSRLPRLVLPLPAVDDDAGTAASSPTQQQRRASSISGHAATAVMATAIDTRLGVVEAQNAAVKQMLVDLTEMVSAALVDGHGSFAKGAPTPRNVGGDADAGSEPAKSPRFRGQHEQQGDAPDRGSSRSHSPPPSGTRGVGGSGDVATMCADVSRVSARVNSHGVELKAIKTLVKLMQATQEEWHVTTRAQLASQGVELRAIKTLIKLHSKAAEDVAATVDELKLQTTPRRDVPGGGDASTTLVLDSPRSPVRVISSRHPSIAGAGGGSPGPAHAPGVGHGVRQPAAGGSPRATRYASIDLDHASQSYTTAGTPVEKLLRTPSGMGGGTEVYVRAPDSPTSSVYSGVRAYEMDVERMLDASAGVGSPRRSADFRTFQRNVLTGITNIVRALDNEFRCLQVELGLVRTLLRDRTSEAGKLSGEVEGFRVRALKQGNLHIQALEDVQGSTYQQMTTIVSSLRKLVAVSAEVDTKVNDILITVEHNVDAGVKKLSDAFAAKTRTLKQLRTAVEKRDTPGVARRVAQCVEDISVIPDTIVQIKGNYMEELLHIKALIKERERVTARLVDQTDSLRTQLLAELRTRFSSLTVDTESQNLSINVLHATIEEKDSGFLKHQTSISGRIEDACDTMREEYAAQRKELAAIKAMISEKDDIVRAMGPVFIRLISSNVAAAMRSLSHESTKHQRDVDNIQQLLADTGGVASGLKPVFGTVRGELVACLEQGVSVFKRADETQQAQFRVIWDLMENPCGLAKKDDPDSCVLCHLEELHEYIDEEFGRVLEVLQAEHTGHVESCVTVASAMQVSLKGTKEETRFKAAQAKLTSAGQHAIDALRSHRAECSARQAELQTYNTHSAERDMAVITDNLVNLRQNATEVNKGCIAGLHKAITVQTEAFDSIAALIAKNHSAASLQGLTEKLRTLQTAISAHVTEGLADVMAALPQAPPQPASGGASSSQGSLPAPVSPRRMMRLASNASAATSDAGQ